MDEFKIDFENMQCTPGAEPLFKEVFGDNFFMRSKSIYEEFLIQKGLNIHFPKKDCRILFKVSPGDLLTIDILVAEFSKSSDPQYLYKEWKLDIGNCLSDWDQWTISDIFIKLFIFYGIHPTCRIKALTELSKITEFRPLVAPWIYRYFNG